jgi:hypothetical protein
MFHKLAVYTVSIDRFLMQIVDEVNTCKIELANIYSV